MAATPIKIGIFGAGRIGRHHCGYLSKDPEHFQITAICDIIRENAESAVREFGGTAYTTLNELLNDGNVEIVIIATPSLGHASEAKISLESGKYVLLEKPIGVTCEDYRILKELASRYPDRLFCGHTLRFDPRFSRICEIAGSGILGKIYSIKLNWYHSFYRRSDWQSLLARGGGQLSVWGPHMIDQGLRLMDSPVIKLESRLERILTPGDADDHLRIVMTGANKVETELEITNCSALPAPFYCRIFGNRGALECREMNIHYRHLPVDFQWTEAIVDAAPHAGEVHFSPPDRIEWMEVHEVIQAGSDGNGMMDYSAWRKVMEECEFAGVYRAIREGIPYPVKNREALGVLEIMCKIKEDNPQFQWVSCNS